MKVEHQKTFDNQDQHSDDDDNGGGGNDRDDGGGNNSAAAPLRTVAPPASKDDSNANRDGTLPDGDKSNGPHVKPQRLASDPFAPERFQLAQDYTALVGGTKQITRVPVGRPDGQVWFQVNPDEEFTIPVALLDLRSERETYIVVPELAMELGNEVVTKRLFQYVTRQGDIGIWPIKLPDAEGKIDPWNESAMIAVETAQQRWIRLVSNTRIGCYETVVTGADHGPPDFGPLTLRDLLAIAFRGKVIDSISHPVLRRLRGEV